MRRLISAYALFLAFLSDYSCAHEVRLTSQHLKLNRQGQSAWQQDIRARADVDERWQLGLSGTYLERFELFEKRAGVFALYSPSELITVEASYQRGFNEVEILPMDQYQVSVYHALGTGMSPFLSYQNSLYSLTHLQLLRLGIELENFAGFIFIPQLTGGEASFNNQSGHKRVYNAGLRAIYYREQSYSIGLYAYRGTEAAQGIFGRSTQTLNTLTGGASAGVFLTQDLKAELAFDYTDYAELKNQFLLSTLNLVWKF